METAQVDYLERHRKRPHGTCKVHQVDLVKEDDGSPTLELRVNFEGRTHTVQLSPDDIPRSVLAGQAEARELMDIRAHIGVFQRALSDLAGSVDSLAAAVSQPKDQ